MGGLIVGAAAGVLLAPKSGVETREDFKAWRRRSAGENPFGVRALQEGVR